MRRTQNRRAAPCVVFFDGLDVTKEIQYVARRARPDQARHLGAGDGRPGTGEAIRFRGLVPAPRLREVAGTACVDFLEKRADVDPKKIGVVAISLGGYYAPRCASLEPRFAACIAWGAIWDYHAIWKKRIEAQFKASLSVPGHHIMWIVGVDTLEEALKKLEPFKLDGVVQKMRCPFLVVHGADDEQIPLADAQALYDACGSQDKTLRVFTGEEGGAQHCQRDYLTLGVRRDVELVRGQARSRSRASAEINSITPLHSPFRGTAAAKRPQDAGQVRLQRNSFSLARQRQEVATMMASPSAVRLTLSPQARASRPA